MATRTIIYGLTCLLLLLILGTIVNADTVELTPAHPSRVDLLTCTYTIAEPGVFRFEFFKNGDSDQLLFERETDKRTVAYRLQGLVNRDRVMCVVSKRDIRGEFNGVGSNTVTVGAFQCNDLNDNDDDAKIDMQDPGCRMPKDDSEQEPVCSDSQDNDRDGLIDLADPGCMQDAQKGEETFENGPACDNGIDDDGDRLADMGSPGCDDPFDDDERIDYQAFCTAHPDNLYCRGLGMNDLVLLCNAAQQPVCREQNIRNGEAVCRQAPDHEACTGVQDLVVKCERARGDLFCNEIRAQMIECRDRQRCLEITEEDEGILCGIRQYDFCPQPAAPAAGAAADQPAPAPQPFQPEAAEPEQNRREKIREAVEDVYRDIRERQRRAAEQEQERRAAQELPQPSPPTGPSPSDLTAQKETRRIAGTRAAGIPTAGVIAAAGGIVAVLAATAYVWARSRRPVRQQPMVPAPAPVQAPVRTMKIRRQTRQIRKKAR